MTFNELFHSGTFYRFRIIIESTSYSSCCSYHSTPLKAREKDLPCCTMHIIFCALCIPSSFSFPFTQQLRSSSSHEVPSLSFRVQFIFFLVPLIQLMWRLPGKTEGNETHEKKEHPRPKSAKRDQKSCWKGFSFLLSLHVVANKKRSLH